MSYLLRCRPTINVRGRMVRRKRSDVVRVALYARVSDPKQVEKALSIPAQLEALRAHARERDWVVVNEYVEPGVSATDDQRPMFRKMMQDVLAPNAEVHAIVVLFTSRFMRHAGKARVWKEHLRRRGIDVIAIQ